MVVVWCVGGGGGVLVVVVVVGGCGGRSRIDGVVYDSN